MSERVEQLSDDIRLICGDCREVLPTLGPLDVVITDPPYGMEYRSNFRIDKYDGIANDGEEWPLALACSLNAGHSKYVFCRWDDIARVPKPKSTITWIKNNWSMGDLNHEHARQSESILFYPGPEHFFPSGRPVDVIDGRRTGNNFHPTEKPVDLMASVVRWTDGVIVDPFMGSGSTGVAAAKLRRGFVGVEIDERHFDTACRRINDQLARPDMFVQPAPVFKQEPLL